MSIRSRGASSTVRDIDGGAGSLGVMFPVEKGVTLLSFVVGLALAGTLLVMAVLTFQQVFHVQQQVEAQISVLDALMEVEDFYRKELGRLQFAPYCPSLLPPFQELFLGDGMTREYRDRMAMGVVISKRKAGSDPIVDLLKLKGHGSGTYLPKPPKNISRLLNGADLLYINGLIPSDLRLDGRCFVGEYDSDLIGLRKGKFYITDCQSALLLEAERDGGIFYVATEDYQRVKELFDPAQVQIYLYKEYLIYLQIRDDIGQLVVDYMDGQAFLRIPFIADMRFNLRVNGLNIKLVAAVPSHRRKRAVIVEEEGYRRTFLNSGAVRLRSLEVRW